MGFSVLPEQTANQKLLLLPGRAGHPSISPSVRILRSAVVTASVNADFAMMPCLGALSGCPSADALKMSFLDLRPVPVEEPWGPGKGGKN